MNQRLLYVLTIILVLLLQVSCSIIQREPKDSAPTRPLDVSIIEDALPQPVVRTRAGNASTYSVHGKTYRVMSDSRGYKARGKASWYGTKFHGQPTANGEIYNMYAMTAAHKTLPIPSYVRVTRVSTGRSIVVRINDRGPFKDDRLIDLSYAAARKLGVDKVGIAVVDVVDVTPITQQTQLTYKPGKVLRNQEPEVVTELIEATQPPGLYLQLGAFQLHETALLLKHRVLSMLGAPVKVTKGRDRLHRVTLGPTDSEQTLLIWQQTLRAHGLNTGFIVQ